MRLGIANDLHAVAAEAAIIRLYVVGNDLGRPSEALAGALFAEALVKRTRDDPQLAALLHNNLGTIHDDPGGDLEVARRHYDAALDALGRRGGASDPLEAIVHHNFGIMDVNHGHLDAARVHFERARGLFVAIVGEEHPLVAHPLIGIGGVELRRGAHEQAMSSYQRAIALVEASLGAEHHYLVDPLASLGIACARTGKAEEAGRHFTRAVDIAEKVGLHSEAVGKALMGLAEQAIAAGAGPQALKLYARASAAFDAALGDGNVRGTQAALQAGQVAAELGELDAAIQWFEAVLSRRPAAEGPERARASAHLVRLLAARGDGATRTCELARTAHGLLADGDPLRADTGALIERMCAAREDARGQLQ